MVQQTTIAGDSTGTTTSGCSCPHMLPCGVCRLLMMNCPKGMYEIKPVWQTCNPSTGEWRINGTYTAPRTWDPTAKKGELKC